MLGQQGLQVRLDAVLLQPGVDAELVGGVVEDLPDRDLQRVPVAAAHLPERGQRLGGPGVLDLPAERPFSVNLQGGLIQFSGLYARSSAWIDTDPSALIRISRLAIGRWAVSRPA